MTPSPLAAAVLAVAVIAGSGCSGPAVRSVLDRAVPPASTPADTPADTPAALTPSSAWTPPPVVSSLPAPRVRAERATVTRVVDGDTVHARIDAAGGIEKIRFIGVDTPESTTRHEPYGAEASRFTKSRLDGAIVYLEYDLERHDRYGRVLAYIWLRPPSDGSAADVRANMFNAALLIEGYAQTATYPPNVRYVDAFRGFQTEARAAGRGLWAQPGTSQQSAAPAGSGGGSRPGCDPSYPDVCIAPPPPDLDCTDISHRRFRVLQPDPHRFDGDRDGIGCES